MSLKNIFKKAAKIAFKVAGDVKIRATITSVSDNGIDDPVTTSVTVDAIREEFSQDDFRGLIFRDLIQPYDLKLIILFSAISHIDTNDKVIIDGLEYSVFGVEKDAADATWTIGIR